MQSVTIRFQPGRHPGPVPAAKAPPPREGERVGARDEGAPLGLRLPGSGVQTTPTHLPSARGGPRQGRPGAANRADDLRLGLAKGCGASGLPARRGESGSKTGSGGLVRSVRGSESGTRASEACQDGATLPRPGPGGRFTMRKSEEQPRAGMAGPAPRFFVQRV